MIKASNSFFLLICDILIIEEDVMENSNNKKEESYFKEFFEAKSAFVAILPFIVALILFIAYCIIDSKGYSFSDFEHTLLLSLFIFSIAFALIMGCFTQLKYYKLVCHFHKKDKK